MVIGKKNRLILQGKRTCIFPNIQQVSLNRKDILGTHLSIIVEGRAQISHLVGEECSSTSNTFWQFKKQRTL